MHQFAVDYVQQNFFLASFAPLRETLGVKLHYPGMVGLFRIGNLPGFVPYSIDCRLLSADLLFTPTLLLSALPPASDATVAHVLHVRVRV